MNKTSEYHKCSIKRSSRTATKMATGSDEDEDSTSKCRKCCSRCMKICRKCCSGCMKICIILIWAAIMVATTVALAIGVKIEDEHTTSHWIRLSLFFILPPFIAIISTTIIAIAVHHCYTADKLVRFIFPYVKRKGGDNVVFGFKLDEYHILTLLWVAIEVVHYVIWAFWFNIILIYPNNSNPHDAYSYELNCYYLNYTEIELSTAERLTTKEAIKCIGFNSNIAGAMSQVTGILAFTWILASILTLILLKFKHCVMKKCNRTQCKQCKQCKHTCSKCSLFYYIVIHIVHLSIDIAWIAIIVNYNDKKWYSYVATPENNLLIAVFLGSVSVIGFPIEKAPTKTLEELCREAMKRKKPQEQIIKKYTKSTQIAECIRILLNETITESNEKDIIADILNNISDEEEELNEVAI